MHWSFIVPRHPYLCSHNSSFSLKCKTAMNELHKLHKNAVIGMVSCEWLPPNFWCGVYGGRETIGVLSYWFDRFMYYVWLIVRSSIVYSLYSWVTQHFISIRIALLFKKTTEELFIYLWSIFNRIILHRITNPSMIFFLISNKIYWYKRTTLVHRECTREKKSITKITRF